MATNRNRSNRKRSTPAKKRKTPFLRRISGRWFVTKTGRFANAAQIKRFKAKKAKERKQKRKEKRTLKNRREIAKEIRDLYSGFLGGAVVVKLYRGKGYKGKNAATGISWDIYDVIHKGARTQDHRGYRTTAQEAVGVFLRSGYAGNLESFAKFLSPIANDNPNEREFVTGTVVTPLDTLEQAIEREFFVFEEYPDDLKAATEWEHTHFRIETPF